VHDMSKPHQGLERLSTNQRGPLVKEEPSKSSLCEGIHGCQVMVIRGQ
jgi:hypothetical protein